MANHLSATEDKKSSNTMPGSSLDYKDIIGWVNMSTR